jgi:4-hydroxybenzoyl-CoA thioesterase/acyl-CoA thioester hydrolase
MTTPFCTTRRVEFRDTDAAGIAHFSVFFLLMEQVEHEFLRSRGLSVVSSDEQGVISWPRVNSRCDFRSAVKFEDVMDIELRIARLGEKSVTYAVAFSHQGRAVAEGEITSVCCRMQKHGPPVSIPIPASIREKLTAES